MRLELREVQKAFDQKQVLKGASFVFEKGKIYGLLGRNGAGKTTLFNCISKEISCDGEIALYDGADDILDFSQIGFTYAHPILPEFLTGYEFLKFYIDINKDKIKDKKSIPEYFDMIKIKEEDWYRLIKDYSHGMKNKMQMICFLITKPPVILLDEPLTSFDVVVAHEIKQMLKAMKQDHIIIFSTHILELAEDLCDEIVILNQGKLEAIDHNMIGAPEFEEKIFEALKEEQHDSYHHSGKDACLCAAGQCSALLCEKITACRRENTVPSVWRDGYQEGDWCHTGCVFRDRCICWYIFVLFADD